MTEEYEPEESPQEITDGIIKGVAYYLNSGLLDRKGAELIKAGITRAANKVTIDPNKKYLSKDEGVLAYSKVLEDDQSALEALQQVALFYGKDQAWIDEVKYNNYIHSKAVTEVYEDHPVQKAMRKDGTFNNQIKYSKTPSQQLRRLEGSKKLHNKLNQLIEEKDTLEVKVEGLEAKSIINEVNVDLTMLTLGLDPMSDKEKASKLKASGFNQKSISDYLGVNIRTVKRWWNTL